MTAPRRRIGCCGSASADAVGQPGMPPADALPYRSSVSTVSDAVPVVDAPLAAKSLSSTTGRRRHRLAPRSQATAPTLLRTLSSSHERSSRWSWHSAAAWHKEASIASTAASAPAAATASGAGRLPVDDSTSMVAAETTESSRPDLVPLKLTDFVGSHDIVADGSDEGFSSPAHSNASTPANYTGPIARGLNTIVDHMWPRMSKYATEIIMTEVQPALQAALPAAIQSLHFDPDRCHLGHRPLEFKRVHIEREGQVTAGGDIQNLIVTARIDWDADCEIFLGFAGAGLGIQGLHVKGVMVIELVGLTDQPPFFEGVRAFFNNRPHIDIKFQGTGQGLLNLSLIRRKIVQVVADGISGAMVLPNRIGFGLSQDSDIFCIKCPPPQGILTLTVESATGLKAMDHSWFTRPSSDPYVIVECGAYRFQSPTKYKTLAPVFRYEIAIPVTEVMHQRLQLSLFDEDLLSDDDFLGKASIAVQSLLKQAGEEVTLVLQDEAGDRGASGSVVLRSRWQPLCMAYAGEHFDLPGVLAAGVHSCSNLDRKGAGAKYWVKASCTGLLPGFPKVQEETDHNAESVPPQPLAESQEDGAGIAGAESMKKRLAILRRYNMSEEEMAQVLHIDLATLHSCLLARSETEAACGLVAARAVSTHEVTWEHGFSFPVQQVSASTMTFEVMRQASGESPCSLGRYTFSAAELTSAHRGTCWRTVELPDSGALLKLKLSMRYLEPEAQTQVQL